MTHQLVMKCVSTGLEQWKCFVDSAISLRCAKINIQQYFTQNYFVNKLIQFNGQIFNLPLLFIWTSSTCLVPLLNIFICVS